MGFMDKVKVIFSKVLEFLLPLIRKFLVDGGLIALQLAFEVVPIVAQSFAHGSGEEKRKEAFKMILDKAKAQGLVLSTSMINAAIEAAVAKLKEGK
jgi:hypothetical protein